MSDTDQQSDGAPHEGEILKANRLGPDQVHVGMDVMSLDGHPVGKVKEVCAEEFLLDRPLARDLWVPYSCVLAAEDYGGSFRRGPVEQTEVVLTVAAAQVEEHGWRHA